MKKRWLAVAGAVVAIAVGVAGGTVLAQEGDSDTVVAPEPPTNQILARVADILALDLETLESAFQQAKKEVHEEHLEQKLDKLVEKDVIDQETADQYLEWQQARPGGLPDILDGRGHHGKKRHGGFGPGRLRKQGLQQGHLVGPLFGGEGEIQGMIEQFFGGEMAEGLFDDSNGFRFEFNMPWEFGDPDSDGQTDNTASDPVM